VNWISFVYGLIAGFIFFAACSAAATSYMLRKTPMVKRILSNMRAARKHAKMMGKASGS